jgi:hypothetical protein
MNYVDRFLSVCPIRKSQLQLLGTACLLLSSKLRQPHPLATEDLVIYTDNSISVDELWVSVTDSLWAAISCQILGASKEPWLLYCACFWTWFSAHCRVCMVTVPHPPARNHWYTSHARSVRMEYTFSTSVPFQKKLVGVQINDTEELTCDQNDYETLPPYCPPCQRCQPQKFIKSEAIA